MIYDYSDLEVSKTSKLADRKRRKLNLPKHSFLSNRFVLKNIVMR